MPASPGMKILPPVSRDLIADSGAHQAPATATTPWFGIAPAFDQVAVPHSMLAERPRAFLKRAITPGVHVWRLPSCGPASQNPATSLPCALDVFEAGHLADTPPAHAFAPSERQDRLVCVECPRCRRGMWRPAEPPTFTMDDVVSEATLFRAWRAGSAGVPPRPMRTSGPLGRSNPGPRRHGHLIESTYPHPGTSPHAERSEILSRIPSRDQVHTGGPHPRGL